MAPTGGETGSYNSEINADFVIWNRQTQLGKVFDSSTCFDQEPTFGGRIFAALMVGVPTHAGADFTEAQLEDCDLMATVPTA